MLYFLYEIFEYCHLHFSGHRDPCGSGGDYYELIVENKNRPEAKLPAGFVCAVLQFSHMEPATSQQAEEQATNSPSKEPWYAPLNRVTPLSKTLAAILFIVLPIIGFWKGYQYGMHDKVLTPAVVEVGYDIGGSNKMASDTSEHTRYENRMYGFSFEIPQTWQIEESHNFAGVVHDTPIFKVEFTDPDSSEEKKYYLEVYGVFEKMYDGEDYDLQSWISQKYRSLGTGYENYEVGQPITLGGERGYFSTTRCCGDLEQAYIVGVDEYIYLLGSESIEVFEKESLHSIETFLFNKRLTLSDHDPWLYTSNRFGFSISLPSFIRPENVLEGESPNDRISVEVDLHDQHIGFMTALSIIPVTRDLIHKNYLSPVTVNGKKTYFVLPKERGYADDTFPTWQQYLGENNEYLFLINISECLPGDWYTLCKLSDDIIRTFSVPQDSDFTLLGTSDNPSDELDIRE